ncbi:MAG: hypothetical protein LBI06_01430 [Treponema sp.]|nr:hypothetical protein [Treponema sp.]
MGALTGTGDNITALHLRSNAALATVISNCLNKTVIKGATDPSYTVTTADIGRIGLGKFITNAVANDTDISETHRIATTPAADVGKLVAN